MNNYENKLRKDKDKIFLKKNPLEKSLPESKKKSRITFDSKKKKKTSIEQSAIESRILHDRSKKIRKLKKSDKINVKKVLDNLKTSKYIRESHYNENQNSGISKIGSFMTDICEKISDHIVLMSDVHKKAAVKRPLKSITLYDMFYKIEWKKRRSGYQPVPAYFKGSLIKKYYPHLLLEYIEKQKILS